MMSVIFILLLLATHFLNLNRRATGSRNVQYMIDFIKVAPKNQPNISMQQEQFQVNLSSLTMPMPEQKLIQYADTHPQSDDTEILGIQTLGMSPIDFI